MTIETSELFIDLCSITSTEAKELSVAGQIAWMVVNNEYPAEISITEVVRLAAADYTAEGGIIDDVEILDDAGWLVASHL